MRWSPWHATKLEVQTDFQIHPAVGQVIRDGIKPPVDILNPSVVDRIANPEDIENLQGDEAVALGLVFSREQLT